MTWRDSVLKPNEIKLSCKVNRRDNSIYLVVPLQQLIEIQAKQSFADGIAQALLFITEALKGRKEIDTPLLEAQMEKWGLGDLWMQGAEEVEKK